jgi:hypothetical protein
MTERVDQPRLSRRDRALLVGLADGALRGRARARAESRLREIPDGARLLERQRRVRQALQAGSHDAPAPPAAPARAGPLKPARARPLAPAAAVAGMLAAALLLLAVLASPGGRPTVSRAADLARLPAAAPAPGTAGPILRAAAGGVRFPNWGDEFGWQETGMRRDELNGRETTTVFYEHEGHRIAYTIVSGPALPPPATARVVRRDGLEIALYRDARHGGHDIAVFERGGRTCVLAGHVEEVATLVRLAAWRGGGSVRS